MLKICAKTVTTNMEDLKNLGPVTMLINNYMLRVYVKIAILINIIM